MDNDQQEHTESASSEMLLTGMMMADPVTGWTGGEVPLAAQEEQEYLQQPAEMEMGEPFADEGSNDEEGQQQQQLSLQPPSLMSLKVDSPESDGLLLKKPAELVLPKALEDVLALTTIRVQELGDDQGSPQPAGSGGSGNGGHADGAPGSSYLEPDGIESEDDMTNEPLPAGDEGDSDVHGPKMTAVEGKQDKNRRKKKRKKENRRARREQMQKAHEERLREQLTGETKQPQQAVAAGTATADQQDNHGEEEDSERAVAEEQANRDERDDDETNEHPAEDGGGGTIGEKGESNGKSSHDEEEQPRGNEEDEQQNGEPDEAMNQNGDDREEHQENGKEKEGKAAPKIVGSRRKTAKAKASENGSESVSVEDVEIEYIPEKITIADLGPLYRQFYRVFEIFKLDTKPKDTGRAGEEADSMKAAAEKAALSEKLDEEEDEMLAGTDEKDDRDKISKRKLKKLTRLSVAELKQLVSRPDVVEMHDVTARDPKLLVQLKSHRNTVQVPRHWCFKRKYLQGKRGIEKPPFDLPAFIKKTGIMEMRASLQEKDEAKTLKAKMRERARPKMGKIDIDYQKLHDAFFKWQTKPRMTIHGDLYYEGKEFETRLKEKKPGDLSEELRIALGMPIGPACHKIPPPWLIAQQRYGPPPSYPNLKIPGLNAPIPEGCSFGYHAGGWGKPPVDESGKPLYGDVFGMAGLDGEGGMGEEEIDRTVWGELESESEESSEEEEDEGEDLAAQPDESGLVTPAEGLVTPSGLTSGVPAGMETPDTIELRKKKIESEMEDNETPVLYHVLPEKRNERIGGAMMASTHVYDIGAAGGGAGPAGGAAGAAAGAGRRGGGGGVDREGMVELALDPSELDLDNEAMAQRYEQQMREQQSHLQKEDLSDMLAEHVARQKSKRKRQQTDTTSKQSKKYKEFKF
ncbi:splicing factor 3B subunit 2-like isoform X2 [Anopheles albimanus]|uniref:PSP proline-rich domain-containing protein n=1 Tax=Anopheles albimanus TaxID=7167 RepID=A0A182FHQ8_ANOAL|nr:splicing factor 3B subunit 2-like isoform X2 [Anopheles albimanus]